MDIKRLNELLNSIEIAESELSEIKSLNKRTASFFFESKIVFEDGDFIYRLESFIPAMTRLKIKEKADSLGIGNFFLEEKIIRTNKSFLLTQQEKVKIVNNLVATKKFKPLCAAIQPPTPIDEFISERVIIDYGEEFFETLWQFCQDLRLISMHDRNIGFTKDNKLVCFDYIADATVIQDNDSRVWRLSYGVTNP